MKLHIWLLVIVAGLFMFISVALNMANAETYIFSAPPRESAEYGNKVYGPIARYLSIATGKHIVYQHQTNWLSYLKDMQEGKYDIVFDGPHFNVWRIRYLNHVPLVRIDNICEGCKPFKPEWVLVYRKETDTKNLNGRTFCLHASPNFGTMSTLQLLFPNPSRQPYIKEMKGWEKMVDAVYNNKNGCEFTVSRRKHLKDKDPKGEVLAYRAFAAFYNQGFTASAALPKEMIDQMREALSEKKAKAQMQVFFDRFVKKSNRGLLVYKDSSEYDQPLEIFSQQYLIPWGLFSQERLAKNERKQY